MTPKRKRLAYLNAFRTETNQAPEVQKRLLDSILREYQDTAYGRKYAFEQITSEEEYKRRLPLTEFDSYTKVEAMHLLYYAMSSGSTGKVKYIPVSEQGMKNHYIYADRLIRDIVSAYYMDMTDVQIHGKIFQIGEFRINDWKDGIPCGIRSSALYTWLLQNGRLKTEEYTAPVEVLFPESGADSIYAKARFALMEPDVTAIHSVFMHRVVGIFSYITENWDILLEDIEKGTISQKLFPDPYFRKQIRKYIRPMPERARQLRMIDKNALSDGIAKKIWKNVKYVRTIGGRAFSQYQPFFDQYIGDIPVHYYAYAASEGIFGIADQMNKRDSYVLLPNSCYFEFLPIEETGQNMQTMGISEIQTGVKYEIVITNTSGLFRYRMQDVVEVIGYYNKMPVIQICYRKNQMMNLAGEKMNSIQLKSAVEEYAAQNGIQTGEYCFYADVDQVPARYHLLMESGSRGGGESVSIDQCLAKYNADYADCRENGELSEAKVSRLQERTFHDYRDYLSKIGIEMGQNKPILMLNTKEQLAFFIEHIEKDGGMT